MRADSDVELSDGRLDGGVSRLPSLMFADGCGGVVFDGRGYLCEAGVAVAVPGVEVWKSDGGCGCGSSKLGSTAAPGRRERRDGCGARLSNAAAPIPGGRTVRAATVADADGEGTSVVVGGGGGWRGGWGSSATLPGQYRPREKPGGSSGALLAMAKEMFAHSHRKEDGEVTAIYMCGRGGRR